MHCLVGGLCDEMAATVKVILKWRDDDVCDSNSSGGPAVVLSVKDKKWRREAVKWDPCGSHGMNKICWKPRSRVLAHVASLSPETVSLVHPLLDDQDLLTKRKRSSIVRRKKWNPTSTLKISKPRSAIISSRPNSKTSGLVRQTLSSEPNRHRGGEPDQRTANGGRQKRRRSVFMEMAFRQSNRRARKQQWHTSQRASIPITVEPPPSLACFVEPIDRC
ncbi:hypothetical protein NC653_040780 [Populus alba x Populus x berolinensis]|uniref:Uncharacterized protein n=1 Tax=Populus alba x Populus x berolinensis TaxID=444605 RepID=A0AAD6PP69_9ROSI|nr:hypothetical protein NC653_040780 [Populus alba x Populus x berolinensis]